MANKSAPWENQQCGRRFCALSGPLSGITKASASLYAHASARHGSIRPPRATIAAADDEVRPLAPVRNQRAARSHEGVDQSRPRLQKPSHVAVMPGPARFGGGRSEGPLAPGSWRLTRDWSSQGPLEEYYFRLRLQSHQPSLKAGGMPTKKEAGTANATAAFHHVVAKGDIEKVKDFVLVGSRCLFPVPTCLHKCARVFCTSLCSPGLTLALGSETCECAGRGAKARAPTRSCELTR